MRTLYYIIGRYDGIDVVLSDCHRWESNPGRCGYFSRFSDAENVVRRLAVIGTKATDILIIGESEAFARRLA